MVHYTCTLSVGVMLPSAALRERRKAQEACDMLLWDLHEVSPPFSLHRFAMFHKVRIPRQNLLDRTGKVTPRAPTAPPLRYQWAVGICGQNFSSVCPCVLEITQEKLALGTSRQPVFVEFGALNREGA